MSNETSELYVKIGTENGNGFDLTSLGEVFNGLDGVIKDIHEISNINGELKLSVKSVEEGSVLLTLGASIVTHLPFEKIPDLLNFLFITAPDLYKKANEFFNEINGVHKTVNDFCAKYPLDIAIAGLFLKQFVPKLINLAPHFKKNNIAQEDEINKIPKIYASKLHNMVVSKKFKKLAIPIAEEKIKYINFSIDKNSENSVSINNSNFEGYLSEDEKILSEWENGQKINLTGEIVAIQSTRGEILRFKAIEVEPKYQLLVAIPEDGKSSENYLEFYKKQVNLEAEVFRSSMYKKPEIIIKNISLMQEQLI